MPLVSVIMPSYNHADFISETIESILNQIFTNIELIIIDDGSKDNSEEIIKDYAIRDSRIYCIFHKNNKGIAKTFNEGIEKAKGKYIAFIGSDDLWIENKLEIQLDVLKLNENLIVWSEGLIVNMEGKPTGEFFTQKHNAEQKTGRSYVFEELLKTNYIFGSSLIMKRKNLGNIRFDDSLKYLNDYRFVVDLAKNYEYFFISEPLAMYRIHGDNSILNDRIGWERDRITIGQYFLQKYGSELSNKINSRTLVSISRAYLEIGEKTKARQYCYRAIKLNPINRANLINLIINFTKKDGAVRNFLEFFFGSSHK